MVYYNYGVRFYWNNFFHWAFEFWAILAAPGIMLELIRWCIYYRIISVLRTALCVYCVHGEEIGLSRIGYTRNSSKQLYPESASSGALKVCLFCNSEQFYLDNHHPPPGGQRHLPFATGAAFRCQNISLPHILYKPHTHCLLFRPWIPSHRRGLVLLRCYTETATGVMCTVFSMLRFERINVGRQSSDAYNII